MDAILHTGRVAGTAAVPPSKSAAHRAVLCAALAGGTSRIENIEYSDDIRATIGAVRQLGAKVVEEERALTVTGRGGDGFATVTRPVFCNESGSTLRFLIPVFSLTAQKVRFTGAGRLFDRPQEVYRLLFTRQGLRFEQTAEGITIFGRLRPGGFTLPGDVSSQFISGLLFAAPLLESESTIEVQPPFESRSYVDLTLGAMQRYGVKVTQRARKGGVLYRIAAPQRYAPCDWTVEADYSQAAFLAVLGVLAGDIAVAGLDAASRQGDRVILDILRDFGGKFAEKDGALHFSRSLLKGGDIDLADCPDLGPVLIALGCFCSGRTTIRNAGRLRLKESDRIAAMQQELAKLGGVVLADGDTVTVDGTALHAPREPLFGHNDHRIVMALAVTLLAANLPGIIRGAGAVRKSWPAFFEVLRSLGADIECKESE